MKSIEELKQDVVAKTPTEINVILVLTIKMDDHFTVIDALTHIEEVVHKANELGSISGTGQYGDQTFKVD